MNTLYGMPPQTGGPSKSAAPVIYARAAFFMPDEEGRRTLSDDLLVEAARRLKKGDGPLDLVLVTDDAAFALVSRLPTGLLLAGVVAEKPWHNEGGASRKIAVVSGVTGLENAVNEGDLLIVDGEKGRVLVEPDAEEFVRLQAERHRARVLLGAAHTFAHTQAGRIVPVWASVQSARDVQDALDAGADGIVLEAGGDLLEETDRIMEADDDNPFPEPIEQMSLLSVVEAVGGGAVGLHIPFGILDPALILTLAGVSELRWAVVPDDLPLPLPELRQELKPLLGGAGAEEDESEENGAAVMARAMPSFAALANHVGGEDAANALADFDEVWLLPNALDDLTLGDVYALPPVRVLLGDALDVLPEIVALGVHGVIVAPALVGVTKDMIRQQPN